MQWLHRQWRYGHRQRRYSALSTLPKQVWMVKDSPVSVVHFRNEIVHVKRDDVFPLAGNKMRKLYWLLKQDASFYQDRHLVSFGGTQSNAMLAIAQLAHVKDVPFTYISRHITTSTEEGNLVAAKALGMQHLPVDATTYQNLVQTHEYATVLPSTDRRVAFIPQGAAFPQARDGIEVLANELNAYVQTQAPDNPDRFAIVVPSGTGTTAFYLSQHTPSPVFAVPCVGEAAYLKLQFQQLRQRDPSIQNFHAPTVLVPSHKARFGRLSWPLYELYHELLTQTSIEFDLLYGCFAWQTLLESLPQLRSGSSGTREILYVHSGGVSGNPSMLARYARKQPTAKQ